MVTLIPLGVYTERSECTLNAVGANVTLSGVEGEVEALKFPK